MVVAVGLTSARAQALPEDRRADQDDEQARHQRQPRVQLLRNDERGQSERDEPEREHAGGMGDGDRAAEEDRVPRSPFVPTRYAATMAFPCPGVSA